MVSVFKRCSADDETELRCEFSDAFNERDGLWRADILSELLAIVQAAYEQALMDERNRARKLRRK